jgi:predicted O-methyltransferase YrrM
MFESNKLVILFSITTLILFLLIFLIYKLSIRLGAHEKLIRDLPNKISNQLLPALETASLEAQNAVSLGALNFSFPVFLGGPSIDSFHARHLVQQLVSRQPKVILELGSGSSTVIIARVYQLLGIQDCAHISIDHEAFFLDLSKRYAELNGVADRVNFCHCPLEPVAASLDGNNWYSGVSNTLNGRKIELLVIDGPPAYEDDTQNARYPALPMLYEHLSPNCMVILDDANRPGEKMAVERWKEQYPEFTVTHYANGKGIAVLTR